MRVSLRGGQGFLQEVGVLHGLLRSDPADGVHGQQLLKLVGKYKKSNKNMIKKQDGRMSCYDKHIHMTKALLALLISF